MPTGTKISNWLFTKLISVFFSHLLLLMYTIGGSTGTVLGNAAVDPGLHDTYYVVAHFHFVLSLGTIIAIFSGMILKEKRLLVLRTSY